MDRNIGDRNILNHFPVTNVSVENHYYFILLDVPKHTRANPKWTAEVDRIGFLISIHQASRWDAVYFLGAIPDVETPGYFRTCRWHD
jgi:hypothetical protein